MVIANFVGGPWHGQSRNVSCGGRERPPLKIMAPSFGIDYGVEGPESAVYIEAEYVWAGHDNGEHTYFHLADGGWVERGRVFRGEGDGRVGQDSEGQVSFKNQGWKVVIQSEEDMQPLLTRALSRPYSVSESRPYSTIVISHNGEPVFSGSTARWSLMQTSGGKTLMDFMEALEALNDAEE